jgi:hypothetical protein
VKGRWKDDRYEERSEAELNDQIKDSRARATKGSTSTSTKENITTALNNIFQMEART